MQNLRSMAYFLLLALASPLFLSLQAWKYPMASQTLFCSFFYSTFFPQPQPDGIDFEAKYNMY